MSVALHRSHAPVGSEIRVAVVTVSDTRTPDTDEGGQLVVDRCATAGLTLTGKTILRDEPATVAAHVQDLVASGAVDAVLLTGGTGLSARDTTVEAVTRLFDKTIAGFGELFRALSFAEIGTAAMLSRATAGTAGAVVIFTMPGSPAAVRLALDRLILPELAHIVGELRRHRPGAGAATGQHHQHHQEPTSHSPDHEHGHHHHEHPGKHKH
jgi:molybdenum cofactor biosynthesis protein B